MYMESVVHLISWSEVGIAGVTDNSYYSNLTLTKSLGCLFKTVSCIRVHCFYSLLVVKKVNSISTVC